MKLHVSDMVKNMSKFNNFATNSDPLFSCIFTLYILILLYFPQSLKHSFSPVILITALILLCLLRLGAKQRLKTQKDEFINASEENEEGSFDQEESCVLFNEPVLNPGFDQYFIGWNVKAPLEVIYEAYEGEEENEDEDDHSNGNELMHEKDYDHGFELNVGFGLKSFSSLSMYYPETDSDSSSDSNFPVTGYWDSPESVCFKWEEEDREESLIEIALDHSVKKESGFGLHFEEDNLIEIDISNMNDGI